MKFYVYDQKGKNLSQGMQTMLVTCLYDRVSGFGRILPNTPTAYQQIFRGSEEYEKTDNFI